MIFPRPRLIAFGIASVAAVAAIVLFTDRDHWKDLDPRTGQHVPTATELVAAARASGDALAAKGLLDRVTLPSEATRDIQSMLGVELSPTTAPWPPDHAASTSERSERREAARAILGCPAHHCSPHELAQALERATGDAQQAEALHALFLGARSTEGLDARAARARRDSAPYTTARALADDYRGAGRARAALRWARIAFDAAPDAPGALALLLDALVANGELDAAAAFMDALGAPNELWRRQRAEFAAWARDSLGEAQALEALIAEGEGTARDRSRLIDLWIFVGHPGRALPHATVLAREASATGASPFAWRLPVLLALESGDTGLALELLRRDRPASDSTDERTALELEILAGDLRLDELQDRLRALAQSEPALYAERYETLLRARNDHSELMLRLIERIRAGATDTELLDEALALALDQRRADVIAWLIPHGGVSAPLRELQRLGAYERAGVPLAKERVRAVLAAAQLSDAQVLEGLDLWQQCGEDETLLAALLTGRSPAVVSPEVAAAWLDVSAARDRSRALALLDELAVARREDAPMLAVLAERAGWFADIERRLALYAQLARLSPDDRGVLTELARAQLDARRPSEAVAAVREHVGLGALARESEALQDLALEAAQEADDEFALLAWIGALSDDPRASPTRLAKYGSLLRRSGSLARAETLLERALQADPQCPEALAALGQVQLANGAPEAASRTLARVPTAFLDTDDEALFALSEARRLTGDSAGARAGYETLARPLRIDDRAGDRRTRRALALLRLGRSDEALLELRALADAPQATRSEQLTLVDALIELRRLAEAEAALQRYVPAGLDDGSTLRRRGALALASGEYERAVSAYEGSRVAGGRDAATGLDLAEALALAGRRRAALALARGELDRAPSAIPVAALAHELEQATAATFGAYASARRAGGDRTRRGLAFASLRSKDDTTRVSVAAGTASYDGQAALVDEGRTRLDTTLSEFWFAVEEQLDAQHIVSFGVHGFPDAPGPTGASLWAGYRLAAPARADTFAVRAYQGDLLADPAAGVALGARHEGVQAEYSAALQGRWWVDLGARYRELSLSPVGPTARRVTSPEGSATVALGRELLGGERLVGDPASFDSAPRFDGLPVAHSPLWRRSPQALSVFASADVQRLWNGAEIATLLPIAARSSAVSIGARYDRALERGLAAMLGGSVGRTLQDQETVYHVDCGVDWRPSYALEFFARADVGRSTARGAGESNGGLAFGVHLRR